MNAEIGSSEKVSPADAEASVETAPKGRINDFDFLVGRWKVHHRRLVGRLAGPTTWEEFDGERQMRKMLDGQATSTTTCCTLRRERIAQ